MKQCKGPVGNSIKALFFYEPYHVGYIGLLNESPPKQRPCTQAHRLPPVRGLFCQFNAVILQEAAEIPGVMEHLGGLVTQFLLHHIHHPGPRCLIQEPKLFLNGIIA